MASEQADNKEAWVKTQQKTFTKWMNNHLNKKGFSLIQDAELDFDTGIKLMEIVSALYGVPVPKHNPTPKMRPHALDNIELALKMVDAAQIKTNFLKPTHLIDHDLKMILGLMWAVILDYAIKGIKDDDLNAKEGLLLWCRKKTKDYREVDPPTITNFTNNWKNGLAFCALIHRHQPQLIDYDSLDKNNAAENLELAFSVAETLGIPRLLDVEDLMCEKPDERSVMTQVAEYWNRFAQQDVKEVAARRAANFLKFTKQMNQLKFDYEQAAQTLLAWIQATIDRFNSTEFGSTLEDAIGINNALRSFILTEKPEKSASKLDLESLFAEIQTQLKVNNRAAYVPQAELAPETIDAAFDALWEAEKKHGTAARQHRFTFVTKKEEVLSEDKSAEFNESYKHFDKDNDGALDRLEFKAACAAMSIPVKDDASLDALMAKVSGGQATISLEQWIQFNTELATDRDTPEQIIASFKTLADDKDYISADGLRVPPLTAEDVEYLVANMPQAETGGLDYAAFVQGSFVRE